MKLETFFENFDLFAEAPDAVGKMRELVLELALQGKLVKQVPAEGDGHALLKLIQQRSPSPAIEVEAGLLASETSTFPSSWAMGRLGEVAEIVRGITFPGSAKSGNGSEGDVACLRTASVQAEIDWNDLIYVSSSYVGRADQWVAPNDILISMANSYALVGKVAIVRQVPIRATFGAFLAAIRPILIHPFYLLYVLRSSRMQVAFRESSSQTTNIANISLGRMRPLPFPLPPIAEQKRIVAKVDELMALCDRLEAQQQEREARHATLARASLARFGDAPTPANLEFLFDKSYGIAPADLRKAILTLAVQGKLVPQDPADEPAEAIVRAVNAERGQLLRQGLLKRAEPIELSEACDSMPPQWEIAPLAALCVSVTDGDHLPPPKSETGVPFLVISNVRWGGIRFDGCRHVTEDYFAKLDWSRKPRKGDILYTLVGSFGIPVLIVGGRPFCVQRHIGILRPSEHLDRRYLAYALASEAAFQQASSMATGIAQKTVPLAGLRRMAIPLPPFSEQGRIVTRVEQLMAAVDRLEAQISSSRACAASLLEAVVCELTSSGQRS